jgi:hypothetical protein
MMRECDRLISDPAFAVEIPVQFQPAVSPSSPSDLNGKTIKTLNRRSRLPSTLASCSGSYFSPCKSGDRGSANRLCGAVARGVLR